MCIEIFALAPERRLIAKGALAQSGALEHPVSRERLSPGAYEVLFHAGDFFAAAGVSQTNPPFLDVVPFRFQITDPDQHYHLPMKITPWGFSRRSLRGVSRYTAGADNILASRRLKAPRQVRDALDDQHGANV
jgi:5-hydroxyisourate hydrolase